MIKTANGSGDSLGTSLIRLFFFAISTRVKVLGHKAVKTNENKEVKERGKQKKRGNPEVKTRFKKRKEKERKEKKERKKKEKKNRKKIFPPRQTPNYGKPIQN